jgi:hypothetical protein
MTVVGAEEFRGDGDFGMLGTLHEPTNSEPSGIVAIP